MFSALRHRLTYANAMATIAVFIALGGSSYAALKVTGKNVRDSSLTGKDLKNDSVTGADVKGLSTKDVTDGSLLSSDFAAGQLPAGAQGAQGPKGEKGDEGDPCSPGNPACVGPQGDEGDPCSPSDPACVGPEGPKGDTGDPGTTGQSATANYGTGAVVTSTSTFVGVPGLDRTFTVPSNSKTYVSTDGGLQTSSATNTGFSNVDLDVFVDNASASQGLFRRQMCANTTGVTGMICNWSFGGVLQLSAGSHRVQVGAALVGGVSATVSGDGTSALQGQLTVVNLKE